jgi:hypothetical protein
MEINRAVNVAKIVNPKYAVRESGPNKLLFIKDTAITSTKSKG